jgi:hypothetical protein
MESFSQSSHLSSAQSVAQSRSINKDLTIDLPTEVILQTSLKSMGKFQLDGSPQPGAYLDLDGSTYVVLERRHRYQLHSGKYQLQTIALYVQERDRPTEQSLLEGRWVIGDVSCVYNARSELLRCSVNPLGPCAGCREYAVR